MKHSRDRTILFYVVILVCIVLTFSSIEGSFLERHAATNQASPEMTVYPSARPTQLYSSDVSASNHFSSSNKVVSSDNFTSSPGLGFASCSSSRVDSRIGISLPPSDLPTPDYDTQQAESFTQNFSAVVYDVKAVPQTTAYGYGPAYLVNGLSSNGYWYQVGLAYDWPYETQSGSFTYWSGFYLVYEVFNSTGHSIYPLGGGAGILEFSGEVSANDTLQISLLISGGYVFMNATDIQDKASASVTYSSEGSDSFLGNSALPTNGEGYFTGLMTEEYQVTNSSAVPTAALQQVCYSGIGTKISSAFLWMDILPTLAVWPYYSTHSSSPALDFNSSGVLLGWATQWGLISSPTQVAVRSNSTTFITGYNKLYSITFYPRGPTSGSTSTIHALENLSVETLLVCNIVWGPALNYTLQLPNGTYSYYIPPININPFYFMASPYSGNITLNGSAVALYGYYAYQPVGYTLGDITTNASDGTVFSVYDPVNGYIYATQPNSPDLIVINGSSEEVIGTVTLTALPQAITYDPLDCSVWVTVPLNYSVEVINSTSDTVSMNIHVGDNPDSIAFDPMDGDMYIGVAFNSRNVTVINGTTGEVLEYLHFNNGGGGIVVDTFHDYLYLTSVGGRNVTVLNATTNAFICNITLPYSGSGFVTSGGMMIYDPSNHEVYITNITQEILPGGRVSPLEIGNSVWAYNGTELMSNIPVGGQATDLSFDLFNDFIYVAVYPYQDVAVINGLNNTNVFGNPDPYAPSSAFLRGIPVEYAYGLSFDSRSHLIYVTGEGIGYDRVGVISTPFKVTFSAKGLPSGANWSVTLLNEVTYSSEGSHIDFLIPDFYYYFSVNAPSGYISTPRDGIFDVNGSNVIIDIDFTPPSYSVSFIALDLPPGTTWSVTLNGTNLSSDSSSLVFSVPNGTYSFIIGQISGFTILPSYGTVTIHGANITENLTFTRISKYTITFYESGLPTGMLWEVTLNGSSVSSYSQAILFDEPNGSYPFTVGSIPGFAASISSGQINVSGLNLTYSLTYSEIYSVTFEETGLPPTDSWSVTLGNLSISSNDWTISFSVEDGAYPYSVNSSGLRSSPSSGTVIVNGNSVTEMISFSPAKGYFVGSVSPLNASISVLINGVWATYKESNGSFNISLNPGTYRISISSPGYVTYNSNATVSSSNATSLSVHNLSRVTKPSSFLPLEIVIVVVVVIAIAAISAVIFLRTRKR